MTLALLCAGCATITQGGDEQLQLTTVPPGAEAQVAGGDVPLTCITPRGVRVKKSDTITVVFKKSGYQNFPVHLTRGFTGAGVAAGTAGNIIAGGIVGMVVDDYTGAAYAHQPNPVFAELVPM
ncbi:MAG: translation initiation factor 2 [Pseudorhodoplanes sp.]